MYVYTRKVPVMSAELHCRPKETCAFSREVLKIEMKRIYILQVGDVDSIYLLVFRIVRGLASHATLSTSAKSGPESASREARG